MRTVNAHPAPPLRPVCVRCEVLTDDARASGLRPRGPLAVAAGGGARISMACAASHARVFWRIDVLNAWSMELGVLGGDCGEIR